MVSSSNKSGSRSAKKAKATSTDNTAAPMRFGPIDPDVKARFDKAVKGIPEESEPQPQTEATRKSHKFNVLSPIGTGRVSKTESTKSKTRKDRKRNDKRVLDQSAVSDLLADEGSVTENITAHGNSDEQPMIQGLYRFVLPCCMECAIGNSDSSAIECKYTSDKVACGNCVGNGTDCHQVSL